MKLTLHSFDGKSPKILKEPELIRFQFIKLTLHSFDGKSTKILKEPELIQFQFMYLISSSELRDKTGRSLYNFSFKYL